MRNTAHVPPMLILIIMTTNTTSKAPVVTRLFETNCICYAPSNDPPAN